MIFGSSSPVLAEIKSGVFEFVALSVAFLVLMSAILVFVRLRQLYNDSIPGLESYASKVEFYEEGPVSHHWWDDYESFVALRDYKNSLLYDDGRDFSDVDFYIFDDDDYSWR